MFDERKAAALQGRSPIAQRGERYGRIGSCDIATYLIAKSGAEGLTRRKLLLLMYLTERAAIKHDGFAIACDELMLTPSGPVMKSVNDIIDDPEKGGLVWTRRIERVPAERDAAAEVSEAGAVYAGERMSADVWRLTLRVPHPRPRWEDLSGDLDEWRVEREEGMPYLGALSRSDMRALGVAWEQYGERDEADLRREVLALPEVGGRTEGELTHRMILEGLGVSPEGIEDCLAVVAEYDVLARIGERGSAMDDLEAWEAAEDAKDLR